MKYRTKQRKDSLWSVQAKGWLTLWFWQSLRRYGGSFGNEDIVFNTQKEAEEFIKIEQL